MIITIDGPSGTGKSTVARKVAEKLGFIFFDTGAMYRAVTWKILKEGIALSDEEKLQKLLSHFGFTIQTIEREKHYFVDEQDVTKEIRSKQITDLVSAVSALAVIRGALSPIQRAFGAKGNVVFEGRDTGSVVFPRADIKIFLTARPQVRAERRLKEIREKNAQEALLWDEQKMLADIERRDHLDSTRKLAPLICPEDACQIDTSDLSIDEVVEQILQYIKRVSSNS